MTSTIGLLPQEDRLRIAHRLAAGVALLMSLQSTLGLLFRNAYRDNLFVRSAWHGNDLVTLLIAAPLLALSLRRDRGGSTVGELRARLLWLGVLAYSAYNYAFYLFGAALNSFFLLFVALFTLSSYSLVLGLARLDASQMARLFSEKTPARAISLYMALWGLALGALWVGQSLSFVLTNQLPGMVTATGHPTNITGALDLSLMVPAVLLGSALLWRCRPWGFILAALMNVKGALYALVLAVSSLIAAREGVPEVGAQIPLWAGLCVASSACCVALFRNRST